MLIYFCISEFINAENVLTYFKTPRHRISIHTYTSHIYYNNGNNYLVYFAGQDPAFPLIVQLDLLYGVISHVDQLQHFSDTSSSRTESRITSVGQFSFYVFVYRPDSVYVYFLMSPFISTMTRCVGVSAFAYNWFIQRIIVHHVDQGVRLLFHHGKHLGVRCRLWLEVASGLTDVSLQLRVNKTTSKTFLESVFPFSAW